MGNHNHLPECAHIELGYCSKCDVAYCKKCNKEWKTNLYNDGWLRDIKPYVYKNTLTNGITYNATNAVPVAQSHGEHS